MRPYGWKRTLLAVPSIAASLLPKIACPACWPAYAGLLSSVGLGFLVPNTTYLLPLTAVFVLLAVGMLAFRAHRRRGYGPFILGVVASFLILFGKFFLTSDPVFYAGLGLLILASVSNSWPVTICCASPPAKDTLPHHGVVPPRKGA